MKQLVIKNFSTQSQMRLHKELKERFPKLDDFEHLENEKSLLIGFQHEKDAFEAFYNGADFNLCDVKANVIYQRSSTAYASNVESRSHHANKCVEEENSRRFDQQPGHMVQNCPDSRCLTSTFSMTSNMNNNILCPEETVTLIPIGKRGILKSLVSMF